MTSIARVVIMDGCGRYLAIHQRGNPYDVAFPGGHVEKGERFEAAARRELQEETGLLATRLTPLCRIHTQNRDTMMFVAEVSGDLRESAEGPLVWEEPEAFLRGKHGQFSAYVFDALNRR